MTPPQSVAVADVLPARHVHGERFSREPRRGHEVRRIEQILVVAIHPKGEPPVVPSSSRDIPAPRAPTLPRRPEHSSWMLRLLPRTCRSSQRSASTTRRAALASSIRTGLDHPRGEIASQKRARCLLPT